MATKRAAATSTGKASARARVRKAAKTRPALSIVAAERAAEAVADGSPKHGAGAPVKQHRKPKRTLTPDNFFKTVVNVVASGRVLARALVKPRTSAALREKVVLGVTSVNDCRYCAWGHTHWAMAHGVSLEEVNQILGHQTAQLAAKDPAEAAAILFAQHYAEHRDQFDSGSNRQPSPVLQRSAGRRDPRVRPRHHARQSDGQHGRRLSRSLPQPRPHQHLLRGRHRSSRRADFHRCDDRVEIRPEGGIGRDAASPGRLRGLRRPNRPAREGGSFDPRQGAFPPHG